MRYALFMQVQAEMCQFLEYYKQTNNLNDTYLIIVFTKQLQEGTAAL